MLKIYRGMEWLSGYSNGLRDRKASRWYRIERPIKAQTGCSQKQFGRGVVLWLSYEQAVNEGNHEELAKHSYGTLQAALAFPWQSGRLSRGLRF
jgi:hypothetical protein